MKLENTFSIPVAAEEAWRVLLDIERIAPCVPGATLTSSEGDTHKGKVKVKLGPIGLTYSGTVTFLSQDAAAKVVVLEAAGREMRGNGTAKAQVTCRLAGNDDGSATDVFVETELAITGKPAQFGRGALAEVSGALIGQFAANLAEELTSSQPAPDNAAPTAPTPTAPAPTAEVPSEGGATEPQADAPKASPAPETAAAPRRTAEPLDLLEAAGGGTMLKQALPYAAGAAALLFLALGLRGRRAKTVEVVVVRCCGHSHPATQAVAG
jgi:uncharacterized protein